jgi:hypothetical protein
VVQGHAFHLGFFYIWQLLAVQRPFFRLPSNCIGTGAGDDVGCCQFFAVGQDRVCFDNPLVDTARFFAYCRNTAVKILTLFRRY